jgi:hypothetical protein
LPDLAPSAPPPRPELLRQLRERLGELVPGLRVVASGMLGADAPIDFVGIEPGGRVLVAVVAGEGGDLEIVARALAQRAWVEARVRDWLQLAPDLGARPGGGVRALALCPGYRPEARAAANALGSEILVLAVYRSVRDGAGIETLVEPLDGRREPAGDAAPRAPEPAPARGEPAPEPFRTGLSDLDLGVSGEERSEFE